MAELEADATDGITVVQDGGGVSIFVSDAAAGRWAIEAASGNSFLALEQQESLLLNATLVEARAGQRIRLDVAAPGGQEAGSIRIDIQARSDDPLQAPRPVGVFMVGAGVTDLAVDGLGLPPGVWTLQLRASAEGFEPAQQDLATPISREHTPDRGIVALRWVETGLAEDGETPRYGLQVTLREYGSVAETATTAQLVVNGTQVEGLSLPGIRPGGARTFTLDLGIAAPLPGQEVRATLSLGHAGHDANLANNQASAALYTGADGVTSPLLLGTTAEDVLRGGAGAERLLGLVGDDRLLAGAGDDTLEGGAGADDLDGREGTDRLVGGGGNDLYRVQDDGDVVVEHASGGMDRVVATVSFSLGHAVEWLTLRGAADLTGLGNAADNRLDGNDGANRLSGQAGDDRMSGGLGRDTLLGDAGRDTLAGGEGADSLAGGQGDDHLRGGLGGDTLRGDAGADRFLFRSLDESAIASPDLLLDFEAGRDRVHLAAIDANSLAPGDQAFTFIGHAAFAGLGAASAGELRFEAAEAGGLRLIADVDGDGSADFALVLAGATSPAAGWLIL